MDGQADVLSLATPPPRRPLGDAGGCGKRAQTVIPRCADLKTRGELDLGANGSGQSPELDKARLRGLRAVGEGRLG